MRRAIIFTIAAILTLTLNLAAQVREEVEVTKLYVPKVEQATKIVVTPDLTDTVKIRPEIDYTVSPRVLSTNYSARLFKPATVTYWEFNRHLPLYLKIGAGLPLNSVADLYLSTQNPDIGYASLYVNHEGEYSDIRNDAFKKESATQMDNRIGVVAGRYLNRHILEGEFYYDNRLRHRYGASFADDDFMVGSSVNFGDAGFRLRIGDDFDDKHRVNFNVLLGGHYFYDNSERVTMNEVSQMDAFADGRLGFRIGRHYLGLIASFDAVWGRGDISKYRNLNYRAALRYSFTTESVDSEVGLDYYHSQIRTDSRKRGFDYILPFMKLRFNIGDGAFVPYVELDGDLSKRDFRSLALENPYVVTGLSLDKNSVNYNIRAGAEGNFSSRFSYRLYLGLTFGENSPYWYGLNFPNGDVANGNYLQFGVEQARHNYSTAGLDIGWKIARDFMFDFSIQGYIHGGSAYLYDHRLSCGLPSLKSKLSLKYEHRSFTIGASAALLSSRYWTNLSIVRLNNIEQTTQFVFSNYHVPVTVDISIYGEVKLSRAVDLFVEGRNLANAGLYDWANYPLRGVGFTAGVKMQF